MVMLFIDVINIYVVRKIENCFSKFQNIIQLHFVYHDKELANEFPIEKETTRSTRIHTYTILYRMK